MANEKTITEKQIEFIAEVFKAGLPVKLAGGYAEEALVRGAVINKHHDVDLVCKKEEADTVEEGLKAMGCEVKSVYDERFQQRPYKFEFKRGEVVGDVTINEVDGDGNVILNIFDRGGNKVRATFEHAFSYPPQLLGDLTVETIAPITILQLQHAYQEIWGVGLREKDLEIKGIIQERFFPGEDTDSDKFYPKLEVIEN